MIAHDLLLLASDFVAARSRVQFLYNFRDSSDPINCSVYSDALSEYNRSYDALAEFMQDDERMTDFAVNGDLGVLF